MPLDPFPVAPTDAIPFGVRIPTIEASESVTWVNDEFEIPVIILGCSSVGRGSAVASSTVFATDAGTAFAAAQLAGGLGAASDHVTGLWFPVNVSESIEIVNTNGVDAVAAAFWGIAYPCFPLLYGE